MKRFSKSILLTILVLAMVFVFVGCKSAQSTASEPEVAEVVEVETGVPTTTGVTDIYTIAGQNIIVTANQGQALISYPANIVTEADVAAVLSYISKNYPEIAKDITYEMEEVGFLKLTYPDTFTFDDLAQLEKIVMTYVGDLTSTKVETVAEQITAEVLAPVYSETRKTYDLVGYEISVVASDHKAVIVYPTDLITDNDLYAALNYVNANFAPYLEGITYEYQPGVITINFPESFTSEDFAAAETIAISYVLDITGADLAVTGVETVEIPAVSTTEIPSAVGTGIVKAISFAGYTAKLVYSNCVATITYPDFITNAEVIEAAEAAYNAYSQYLLGTTLKVDKGVAVLTFPTEISEDDINVAVALLGQELPAYIQSKVVAQQTTAVAQEIAAQQPAATTTTAPAATTTTPAATTTTTPAATTTTTTTTKATTTTSSSSSSTTTSAPAAAKKSNTGLIIVIIVLALAACAAVCIILLKKKKK